MTGWDLPYSVSLPSGEYKIQTDFRDILEILSYLQNDEDPENIRLYVALSLFYTEFDRISPEEWHQAAEQMMIFIACGVPESETGKPFRQLIDWEQDRGIIVSDVNKVAGCEIRALPELHWWTFIAYFGAIGEGQLSTVVSIRDKRGRGKKLENWEQEYYINNRARVDIKPHYTAEEFAEQERLKQILGD